MSYDFYLNFKLPDIYMIVLDGRLPHPCPWTDGEENLRVNVEDALIWTYLGLVSWNKEGHISYLSWHSS